MDYVYFIMYCSISLLFLDYRLSAKAHADLSGKLSEYGLIVPFSTDSRGRYVSHVVSAASGGKGGGSHPGRRRVARSASETLSVTSTGQHLFFNVTVFGKELHLRLKANRRLVAPGASVEWQEDFEEKAHEQINGDCVFTGDVSDMPKATVAISNCDGLAHGPRPVIHVLSIISVFLHPETAEQKYAAISDGKTFFFPVTVI